MRYLGIDPGATGAPDVYFFCPGIPRPAGSKRAFLNRKTGKPILTDASGQAGREWRSDVKAYAQEAMRGRDPLEGPLDLRLVFCFPRPQSHFGKRKGKPVLKDNAPVAPTGKPDLTKLIRSVEDAMTGIVYRDDAQIVAQVAHKQYRVVPGAAIEVKRISREEGEKSWM